MRKQAKLDGLPSEDQQYVLQLCATHSYDRTAAILAKPRDQGGLELSTNRSALCRFAQKHDTDPLDNRLEPILKRLKEMHPADSLDYSTALSRLLQERIFAHLVAEDDFHQVRREFDAYLTLKRLILAERKVTRKKPDPNWLEKHNALFASLTAKLDNPSQPSHDHLTTKPA